MALRRAPFQAQAGGPRLINTEKSFTPAVFSTEQFAEVKQLTVEQFEQIQEFMDLQIRMAIPGYELAKLQLGDFVKHNIPAQPNYEPERTRLVNISVSKIPELEEFK